MLIYCIDVLGNNYDVLVEVVGVNLGAAPKHQTIALQEETPRVKALQEETPRVIALQEETPRVKFKNSRDVYAIILQDVYAIILQQEDYKIKPSAGIASAEDISSNLYNDRRRGNLRYALWNFMETF